MSKFYDLLPTGPSANAGRESRLAESHGAERVEKTNPVSGSAAVSTLDWLTENLAALLDSNRFVERHGLPLRQYRNF
jgi:hypothetical protein